MRHLTCLLAAVSIAALAQGDEGHPSTPTGRQRADTASRLAALELSDVTDTKHRMFSDRETKAAVLIFVSADCPIANAFQPELRELNGQFGIQNIRSFLIYSMPGTTTDRVQKHVADFKIDIPAVVDTDQAIARLAAAKVTPEAVVVNRKGEVIYRGRISNLYEGYGRKRPQATRHELRDALTSVVAGKPIVTSETKPLGCFIPFR